jgi:glutamine amidotransferase
MGWNNLEIYEKKHPILKNISDHEQFYFVHSYYLNTLEKNQVIADTVYSHKIPAIVGKDNYIGVQFHPEKSSNSGQKIITNWLKWKH